MMPARAGHRRRACASVMPGPAAASPSTTAACGRGSACVTPWPATEPASRCPPIPAPGRSCPARPGCSMAAPGRALSIALPGCCRWSAAGTASAAGGPQGGVTGPRRGRIAHVLRCRHRRLAPHLLRAWPRRAARPFHARFLAEDGLAFDIGAHVGDRTASFRRLGARVVALEPQPRLMRALRLIFRHDPGVTLVEALAGAAPGEAMLRLNSANPTVATASAEFIAAAAGAAGWEDQHWDGELRREVTTLDALAATHGRPAFIKIDVEGHEAAVLEGLSQPPAALSFEFTTIQRGVAAACLARLARSAIGISMPVSARAWTSPMRRRSGRCDAAWLSALRMRPIAAMSMPSCTGDERPIARALPRPRHRRGGRHRGGTTPNEGRPAGAAEREPSCPRSGYPPTPPRNILAPALQSPPDTGTGRSGRRRIPREGRGFGGGSSSPDLAHRPGQTPGRTAAAQIAP